MPLLLTAAIQADDGLRRCCLHNESSSNDFLVSKSMKSNISNFSFHSIV